jgi:hypothetical protein
MTFDNENLPELSLAVGNAGCNIAMKFDTSAETIVEAIIFKSCIAQSVKLYFIDKKTQETQR